MPYDSAPVVGNVTPTPVYALVDSLGWPATFPNLEIIPTWVGSSMLGRQPEKARPRTRKLPTRRAQLRGLLDGMRVSAVPDTGAQGNFVSANIIKRLGVWSQPTLESERVFKLANGRPVSTRGQVQLGWSFEGEASVVYSVTFNILENCPDDVILGNAFLQETLALTTYSHRISYQQISAKQRYRIHTIGTPSQHLPGYVDYNKVSAFADTGSELNLMSEDYARGLGYEILSPTNEQIFFELADGSFIPSPGYVEAMWSFEDDPMHEIRLYFDILPASAYEIVLGGGMLFENEVFEKFPKRLITGTPVSEIPELCYVAYYIKKRRNRKRLELLQEEEQQDSINEEYRRHLLRQQLEDTHEAAMEEDRQLHQEWQERSTRRQAEISSLLAESRTPPLRGLTASLQLAGGSTSQPPSAGTPSQTTASSQAAAVGGPIQSQRSRGTSFAFRKIFRS